MGTSHLDSWFDWILKTTRGRRSQWNCDFLTEENCEEESEKLGKERKSWNMHSVCKTITGEVSRESDESVRHSLLSHSQSLMSIRSSTQSLTQSLLLTEYAPQYTPRTVDRILVEVHLHMHEHSPSPLTLSLSCSHRSDVHYLNTPK